MALGFYNPLQRLLDGAGNRDNLTRAKPNYDLADRPALIPPNMIGRDNLNVTGQPVRSPEGGINRPSPVYDRPAFTPAGAFNPMVYHYTNPMVYQGPSDRELMPAEMYLRGVVLSPAPCGQRKELFLMMKAILLSSQNKWLISHKTSSMRFNSQDLELDLRDGF